MISFGRRLSDALTVHGPLCVGIDPHAHLLAEWGLPTSAAGAREFGLRTVDAAAGAVGVVKPQVAFFECYGSAGFAALEDVLAAARDAGLLIIADAKRGDIGTSMDAYAQAWLDDASPLAADAVTVNPYLGPSSLATTIERAQSAGRGVFVLAATSNPDAATFQAASVDGATLSAHVAGAFRQDADAVLSDVGFVVGATVDRAELGLTDAVLAGAPILAPGFGAQGAVPADLPRLFGALSDAVVASESRSILSAGPDGIAARVRERADAYRGLTHE